MLPISFFLIYLFIRLNVSVSKWSKITARYAFWLNINEMQAWKFIGKNRNPHFFWSVFSCFWTDYRDLRSKSPYSVWIKEKTDQKTLRISTPFTQWEFYIELFPLLNCPWKKTGNTYHLQIYTCCEFRNNIS